MIPSGRLGTSGRVGYIRPYALDYYVMTTTPAPKDGAYEMRLTGELDEVEYVDEVGLLALYCRKAQASSRSVRRWAWRPTRASSASTPRACRSPRRVGPGTSTPAPT